MQTVETLNEGLKRAYTLTITAADIDAKVDAEVKRVAPTVKMPGFRPGKVPANLIRKMHGEALSQDALNSSIQDGIQTLIAEQKLRPATAPQVSLEGDYAPGKDAAVTVSLEVLPDVPAPAIDEIKLERLTVPADEAVVDQQLEQLASNNKRHNDAEEGHEAATGDLVVMDFVGKVDGVAFDGGTGEGMAIEIGSGRLIPGFEDQLIGVKKGDEKTINVTFPDDYQAENLKGKAATFDLKITDVKVPAEGGPDDEFAKSLGLESLEQLRGLIKGQVEQELNGLTRTHMKRKLLDQLAAGHDFDVPPSMVEAEFDQIWAQLQHEAGHEADPEAARAELEAERDDYRQIAVRRVRLGLLLSEIGQKNGIEVSQQEMQRLIMQAAQQYGPEDRQRFIQYVQQEPMAAAQLRAPLYEDKVVDFLFGKAEITDREVTREELEAAIESEEGAVPHVHGPDCNHDHDHDHAKPVKKAAKAKPAAEASAEGEAATDAEAPKKKAPAKKAPAKKAEAAPAEAAEGEAAPAPAKKPRAKKKVETEASED
ncbi:MULTISPECIES: trigger factor [Sphingomonas]|uniref:Trigger factor n=1 Tax=Sphingomonas hankookensis TaxID=563996 RepID=A0ABR5YEX6_9SPHN|nr:MULTISPECIES: trigger factor [Sphingomonas]KZE15357.1 trigger factor [Sphingomonas hankookensis]PZT96369.1 MAG: trigger factor [Sphingomonas sp.]RSV30094.1 trigger factor [Sphingomonas sp. ABOLH]WCP70998.1 trigger factor [Sphingomonas hankookensis]